MKKILILCTTFLLLVSCKEEQKDLKATQSQLKTIAPVADKTIAGSVIYEANIRQYSKEGTFEAFTKDIPTLKELGVKVIWIMPINPISKIKRKATGDTFTSDIEDAEERKKYLGSYYSVSDYKAINPEFGTLQDFKNLVTTAHENDIYVIIDWVPNHTGWDHPWILEHPDFYTQNEKGEIIDPVNPDTGESWGWTDTADLNYDNQEMRTNMIADMKYWVEEADVDGFRMDVAHKVPPAFFKTAIKEMETVKPVFMLAEAEQVDLFENGFDMHYAWEGHHLLNRIAKGESSINDLDRYLAKQDSILEDHQINMNFITNHDENSWAGTLRERMPNNKELFTALIYMLPGMPLVYSGQEYDLDHRLKFFEKDSIPKTKGAYFELLKKLGALKNANLALGVGKNAGTYTRIDSNNEDTIFTFERSYDDKSIVFIGNFSDESTKVNANISGNYIDYISGESTVLDDKKGMVLDAWEYHIFIKN